MNVLQLKFLNIILKIFYQTFTKDLNRDLNKFRLYNEQQQYLV
jgi:hypothetical protein